MINLARQLAEAAAPCCSSGTGSTRCERSATGSSCCATAGSSPTSRPHEATEERLIREMVGGEITQGEPPRRRRRTPA